MTSKQERVILQATTNLGVPYDQTKVPEKPPYKLLDCSALILTAYRDANLDPPVIMDRKSTNQAEQGIVIYDAEVDGELDYSILEPADIICYDLHKYVDGKKVDGHDNVVDHVGMFIGFSDKKEKCPKVIDASSSGVSIRSIYVGIDHDNIEKVIRVI